MNNPCEHTGAVRSGTTLPAESPAAHSARVAADLIYLVACAVREEPPLAGRVQQMDLPEVYRLSQEHMLTAAAAFALERVIPLPHYFDQAKKKAIRKLALFDVERAAVFRELEKEEIWYLPLKGILLKDDYPKAAMREMSDNDVLVDSTRMPDVRTVMERLGYTCDHYQLWNHDVYSKPPTLEFEMHHALILDDSVPLITAYFADVKSKTTQNGFACALSHEDFYLYVLCHIYKHFIHGGTGLRSLLDVYVFLRSHPGLDRAYLDQELGKLQVADFEQRFSILAQKVFEDGVLDEKEQRTFAYLLGSGSKGTTANMEYNAMAANLGNDDSPAAKRRFLKSRIFISGKALEHHYPFVAKHRALYPLLLVYRPFKGALTHPKGIVAECKKIIHFKKKEEP